MFILLCPEQKNKNQTEAFTFRSLLLKIHSLCLKLCLFQQLAIADCGGIEALIEILQETEKTEVRTVLGYLLALS